MGKSKAPPPPDYAAAATAQGAANVEAAQTTAALNRPTQIDSNGSQEWSLKPGADPKNPQPGDWIVNTKLNATQQALKDQQDRLSGQYAGMAEGVLGTIGKTMSEKFDTSGLPQAQQLNNSNLQEFGKAPTVPTAQQSLYARLGQAAPDVPQDRASLSAEGLGAYGSVDKSTEASRQRVTDALYGRQMALLNPQIQQQSSDLTSRLAAQGITEGSDAFNRASDNQARQQAEATAAARNDAILAGGAEDSRITGDNLNVAGFQNATRQQQLGERATIAGFNNNNLDTTYEQGLSQAGFNNGVTNNFWNQTMAGRQFDNEAANTKFNQGLSAAGYNNGVRSQQFGENQAMTQANNTLHSNAVAEALMQRQLGMNEANALRTGAQVGIPNFQAYGGGGQVAAAPVYQATGDRFDAQMAANNANNANSANTFGSIAKVGTMAMMSDRRMKRDIVKIGELPSGLSVYSYNYVWGQPHVGVMADEVKELFPDAVVRYADGYDRVDYSKVQ